MNNLFQTGEFTLASGAKSNWKIECDALTKEDWDGLASMLIQFLPPRPFGRVLGVPRGGIPLAEALEQYSTGYSECPTLIVDDVWTTGGSMRSFIKSELGYIWPNDNFFAAVIFARNPTPVGVTALFTMRFKGVINGSNYVCPTCGATKTIKSHPDQKRGDLSNFPNIIHCGYRGCEDYAVREDLNV